MNARDLARHVVQSHGLEQVYAVETALNKVLDDLDGCEAVTLIALASCMAQRLRPGAVDVSVGVDLLLASRMSLDHMDQPQEKPDAQAN